MRVIKVSKCPFCGNLPVHNIVCVNHDRENYMHWYGCIHNSKHPYVSMPIDLRRGVNVIHDVIDAWNIKTKQIKTIRHGGAT